jgi:nucleotide-binding universal stress UspA family protein
MSAVLQIQNQEHKQSIGFKQILVATDFSDASQRGFDYAVAIARRYGSALLVVHSIPPEPNAPVPIYPLPRELDRARLEAEEEMKKLSGKRELTI